MMSTQPDAAAIHCQRLRAHGAEYLKVSEDAPWEEVRQRLLAQVEAADFVPELHVDIAWRVLQNPACEARAVLSGVYENAMREEIDATADDWFRFSIAQREASWYRLVEQAGNYPRLLARLKQLQPAVTLDAPPVKLDDSTATATVDELAALFSEQIIARPIAAALRRHAWLEQSEVPETARMTAIADLKRRSPQLTGLATDLVKSYSVTNNQLHKLARWHNWRRRPEPQIPGSWVAIGVVVLVVFSMGMATVSVWNEQRKTPARPVHPPLTAEQQLIEEVRIGINRDYKIVPDADGFGEHVEKLDKPRELTPVEEILLGVKRSKPRTKSTLQEKRSASVQEPPQDAQVEDTPDAAAAADETEAHPEIDPEVAAIIDGLVPEKKVTRPAD